MTRIEDYLNNPKELGAAYREVFGFPAMATLEVSRLVEREALVEIKVVAGVVPE